MGGRTSREAALGSGTAREAVREVALGSGTAKEARGAARGTANTGGSG